MTGTRALALLSLGAAGLLWGCSRPHGAAGVGRTGGIAGLAQALGPRRLLEPRLTGGFAYAPCQAGPAGGKLVPNPRCSEPLQPGTREWRAAAEITTRLRRAAEHHPTPENRQAYAISLLLSGEDPPTDLAVEELAGAAETPPSHAGVWSDLAAAYIVRAQSQDQPYDLLRGLAAASRSVAQGRLAEARFNRALALQYLSLPNEARAAWQDYLGVDSSSPWAAEARARRQVLDSPTAASQWRTEVARLESAAGRGDHREVARIVQRFHQAAREHAEQELLGKWAEATWNGDGSSAARFLASAREIGAALAAEGEHLIQDAVATIDRATPGERRELAQGHRAFYLGHRLYLSLDPGRAAVELTAAVKALTSAGSPFAARAAFFLACCDYLERRHGRALAAFDRMAAELAGRPYPALLGHIAWMQALIHGVSGQLAPALDAYDRARARFAAAGESENVSLVQVLTCEALEHLGRGEEAWEHCYRALQDAAELRDPRHVQLVYSIAADTALQEGFPEIALYFRNETVAEARRTNPTLLVEALLWRGLTEERLGRRPEALADFARAEGEIPRLPNAALRQRKEADLAMIRGLTTAGDPRRAVPALTAALAVYQQDGHRVFSLLVRLTRARAYRLLGERANAERDLREGLAIYEQLGENLTREELRLAFLAETEGVYDEMIALQVESGRTGRAFAYADRARSRELRGSAARAGAGPAERRRLIATEPQLATRDEIRRQLPPATTLVQYSVLDDRILIWLVQGERRSGQDFFEQRISRSELERLAAGLRRLGSEESPAWIAASSRLFDLLVRPWRARIQPGESLLLVPDKVLHAIPFAALRERESGHYLFEDHPLAFTPSASFYIAAPTRPHLGAPAAPLRALVVADPQQSLRADLGRLPEALEEGRRVAAMFGVPPLEGPAADRASFLAAAPRARFIHFGGHAVVNGRNPLLSMLLFAPGKGEDRGALYARDIYSLDFSQTALVTLAACDTGEGYVPGGGGIASLARAFLGAGAQSVVASLWKVDDTATSRLFTLFYRQLLAHQTPANALRAAQLALYHGGEARARAPAAWGAFEVLGASAP